MALFRCGSGGGTDTYFHSYGQVTAASSAEITNVIGNVQFLVMCATSTPTRDIACAPSGKGYIRKTSGYSPAIASGGGFTQTGTTLTVATGASSSITYDVYYWSDAAS